MRIVRVTAASSFWNPLESLSKVMLLQGFLSLQRTALRSLRVLHPDDKNVAFELSDGHARHEDISINGTRNINGITSNADSITSSSPSSPGASDASAAAQSDYNTVTSSP